MKGLTQGIVLATLVAALLGSCSKAKTEADIPAYIHVPSVEFEAEPGQGSSSSQITEVWVSVNNQRLGAYAVPATIPIIGSGPSEIRLEAGIRDNGIASFPTPYAFYADDLQTLNLQPQAVDTLPLKFGYDPEVQFAFIDDFETGPPIFGEVFIGGPENAMQRVQDDPFEGAFSGLIELDTLQPVVSLITTQAYSGLTNVNPRVYLEINYRSDVPVVFGIAIPSGIPGEPQTFFSAGFNRSNAWNKIYLSLGSAILDSRASTYQIVLEAFATSFDDFGSDGKARVYLDNLKLVHF